ncbi:MAG: tRNA (N6-threonylcarbamoyladenosine(37)-N6)-methyltransferase TrmO [Deltaproteobacteria bacterium]|nr:MAG: tRNA (N6-threonylcarbamoyladenosine(37)-N6)-methyltransferase TrmO [Deltaproteobacteria bacterium]
MPTEVTFTPIGVAKTPFTERADAPRQPRAAEGVSGQIVLYSGKGYEDALADIEQWDYLWVLFVFDRNVGRPFRPKVLPPRSETKRGVFATRSPHRPNPIGMSVVRLESVHGLTLNIRDLDILDGSPILDIKPYLAWSDAIPGASAGWLDAPAGGTEGRPDDPARRWTVAFTEEAEAQISFLEGRGVTLRRRLDEVLALGPRPHAYRRIREEADGTYTLALKDWRARFEVAGGLVEVTRLVTGYRPRQLHGDGANDPSLDVHRAFVEAFGFD